VKGGLQGSIESCVAPSRRGLASGLIFVGVGLGIVASGTLVPLLLRMGLAATWCGLGALALLLTAGAWSAWPNERPTDAARRARSSKPRAARPPALSVLYVEYALTAVGLVPHMVFLVDFVARGLGQGLDSGARIWVLYGLGAMLGPVLAGLLADRIGFRPALRLAFTLEAATVALLAITGSAASLIVSSVIVGALTPSVVPLVLGRIREIALPDAGEQTAAWSIATAAFALGQAAAAYGFSFLFAQTGNYALLFALGAVAAVVALATDLVAPRRRIVTSEE